MNDLHDDELEEVFQAEAAELLADLERNLLRMEAEGAGGPTQTEAYRQFHTLKGMARMAGREELATICHAAETALRPGETPRADELLQACDKAARLLSGIEDPEDHLPEGHSSGAKSVPVDRRRLDTLLDLVGELVVAENRLRYDRRQRAGGAREASMESLGRVVQALQDEVVRARLIPARTLFAPMRRLARDAAHAGGKSVRVEVDGGDLELDRAIVDRLTGALGHLVQNAVVHGIEPPEERAAAGKPREGLIRLDARREHEIVLVEVSDDGRGVDPDAIERRAAAQGLREPRPDAALTREEAAELLVESGFTTRAEPGARAGRGVGLTAAHDVARSLGGDLHVRATEGEGLHVTFRLPPSVAVLETLVARAGETTVALPLRNVRRIAPASEARRFGNGLAVQQAGAPVTVRTVDGGTAKDAGAGFVILADGAAGPFALQVETVVGTHSSVLKPIHTQGDASAHLLGATVLGSGELAVLLNPDAFGGAPSP